MGRLHLSALPQGVSDTLEMYLNFLMLHACFMPITPCFTCASGCPRCHNASSLFYAIFYSRKVTNEIFSELDETQGKSLFHRKTPEARRGGAGGP
jgi:hypothetical protein